MSDSREDNKMSYKLAHHAETLNRYQAAYSLGGLDSFWFNAMLSEAREIRKVIDVYEQELALVEEARELDEQADWHESARDMGEM